MRIQKIMLPAAVLLLFAACSDDRRDEDRVPTRPFGTLELRWSIDGETDPAACEALDATAFEVIVFDEGYFVTEREVPCSEFEASIELFVDDYVARSTLVDQYDFPVTRRIVEDFFLIEDGEVTRLAIDFASDTAGGEADAGVTPVPDAGPEPSSLDAGPDEPVPADAGDAAAAP